MPTFNPCGTASAAKVPVKRYNLLLPAIYPVTEPAFDKAIPMNTERAIKKVSDYLEINEHRIPKVSRRLARRLSQDLRKGHFGYIRVTVEAYKHFLNAAGPSKAGFYAPELVMQTPTPPRGPLLKLVCCGAPGPTATKFTSKTYLGSVIGLLITHPLIKIRLLGVDLLITFLKLQQSSDWLVPLEGFVPLVCHDASPPPPSSSSSSTRKSAEKNNSKDDEQEYGRLQSACLRALLEHLRYCRRIEYVSHQLTPIMFAVLETMEAEHKVPHSTTSTTTTTTSSASKAPHQISRRMSVGERAESSPPQLAATIIFQEIALMTRDVAEGNRVINLFLRFLDSRGRWLNTKSAAAEGFKMLKDACQRWQHRYLFYVALLTHTAEAVGINEEERAAVVEAAYNEAMTLDNALTMPALRHALTSLPQALKAAGAAVPSSNTTDSDEYQHHSPMWEAVSKFISMLSKRLDSTLLVSECVMAALPRYDADVYSLMCCTMALQARLGVHTSTSGENGLKKKGRGMGGAGKNMIAHQLLLKLTGIFKAHESSATKSDTITTTTAVAPLPLSPRSQQQQRMRVLLAGQLLLLFLQHGGGEDSGAPGLALRPTQIHIILSSLWYLVAREDSTPKIYAMIDAILQVVAKSSSSSSNIGGVGDHSSFIVQFICTLRYGDGPRLKTLPPHCRCAVFLVCASAAKRLVASKGRKIKSSDGILFDENSDRYQQALVDSLGEDASDKEKVGGVGGLNALRSDFSQQDIERAAALFKALESGGGEEVEERHSTERCRAALGCTADGDFVPHRLGGAGMMHEESEWLKHLREAAAQWKAEEEEEKKKREEGEHYVDAVDDRNEDEEGEGTHVRMDEVMASIKRKLLEEDEEWRDGRDTPRLKYGG